MNSVRMTINCIVLIILQSICRLEVIRKLATRLLTINVVVADFMKTELRIRVSCMPAVVMVCIGIFI